MARLSNFLSSIDPKQALHCLNYLERKIDERLRAIPLKRQEAQQRAEEYAASLAAAQAHMAGIKAEREAILARRTTLIEPLPLDMHRFIMQKLPIKDLLVLERINKRFQELVGQVLRLNPLLKPLMTGEKSIKENLRRMMYHLRHAASRGYVLPPVLNEALNASSPGIKCPKPELVLSLLPCFTNSEILTFIKYVKKHGEGYSVIDYLIHLVNTNQIVLKQNGDLTDEEKADLNDVMTTAAQGLGPDLMKFILKLSSELSIPLNPEIYLTAVSEVQPGVMGDYQDELIETLKVLLDAGATVPNLHSFMRWGVKTVNFLFRRGASLEARVDNQTPLELAKSLQSPDLVVCLMNLERSQRPAVLQVEDVSDTPEALKKLAKDQETRIQQLERIQQKQEQDLAALESSNQDYVKEVVPLREAAKEAESLRSENASLKTEVEALKEQVRLLAAAKKEAERLREEANHLRQEKTRLKKQEQENQERS